MRGASRSRARRGPRRMQEPELEPAAVKLDAGSATASFEPLDAAAAPIAEPPDLHKHPILEQWEYNSDGSIAGRVYGKKGFKEGEQMTTSIVPEKTRYATYVITGSGSIYRLGEKLAARVPADPKALRVRAPVDDLAAQARAAKERSAPAVAKSKIIGSGISGAIGSGSSVTSASGGASASGSSGASGSSAGGGSAGANSSGGAPDEDGDDGAASG